MSFVEELVVDLIRSRAEVGLEKYGVGMDRDDWELDKWQENHLEELLDAAVYTQKSIIKTKELYEKIRRLEKEVEFLRLGVLKPLNEHHIEFPIPYPYWPSWAKYATVTVNEGVNFFKEKPLYDNLRGYYEEGSQAISNLNYNKMWWVDFPPTPSELCIWSRDLTF